MNYQNEPRKKIDYNSREKGEEKRVKMSVNKIFTHCIVQIVFEI